MKTNLLQVSVLAVIAAAAVHAQGYPKVTANVPFDFVAGDHTFRAGQYTVDQGRLSGTGLLIECLDHKDAAFALANSIQSSAVRSHGRLVFHRYRNTYFLSEVWVGGGQGRWIATTHRERELAAKGVMPQVTTLLASR